MSGTGKKLHENFGNLSGKVSSSARQHEDLSSSDHRTDMAPVDNAAECRPAKLSRYDLGTNFGLEDNAVAPSLASSVDEKPFLGDVKNETKVEKLPHIDYRAFLSDRGDYRPWKREKKSGHRNDSWELEESDYFSIPHTLDHVNYNWSRKTARSTLVDEDREFRHVEEAMGENKIDVRRQEKEKEREKKMKDNSHREKEDRDREERADWRAHTSEALKESWDREREKKEKIRDKDWDKRDYTRRIGKDDVSSTKKELDNLEGLRKPSGENMMTVEFSETEMDKRVEIPRHLEKVDLSNFFETEIHRQPEGEERKAENNKKIETDRNDKNLRDQEKEAEDAVLEEGTGDREKEAFNYSFQPRKRMIRARGHSQIVGKEGRPRFPLKDAEGNPGNTETTFILYRTGEYMPELSKAWKEYELSLCGKTEETASSGEGPTLEIRIPAKLVTTSNHQVRGSQLWGTDMYTDDSDLVAVLMHTGYYRPTASPPPPSVLELRAMIRVLPPQDSYTSTLRNNVRSRAWGAASGCSYSVEHCHIVKVGGGYINLEPCLTRIWAVAPTLAPATMERTMTTRAASANAYRQQRFIQEVTIQYNLCNEPWMKYSMSIVADRGLKRSQFTSTKLRRGEVLYVETHRNRYELCFDGEKVCSNGVFGATTATSAPDKIREGDKTCNNLNGEKNHGRSTHVQGVDASDYYRWSRCKQPLPLKMMLAKGVPLPSDFVEVLEDRLAWEEIQWSQAGVWIRGKEFPLARAQFLSPNQEDMD